MIHEAVHVSIDDLLYGTQAWNDAVAADNKYISDYAKENPQSEDIAETYLVWFATQYASEQFTAEELADWDYYLGNRFRVLAEFSCGKGMMTPYDDCTPPS